MSQNGAFEYGNHPYAQGRSQNPTMGREHGVMWIAREVIRPNGTKTQYFQRKCAFQRNQQNGMGNAYNNFGEYTAYVNIIPEITEGRGWSNVYRMGQQQSLHMPYTNGYMNGNGQQETMPAFADNVI